MRLKLPRIIFRVKIWKNDISSSNEARYSSSIISHNDFQHIHVTHERLWEVVHA